MVQKKDLKIRLMFWSLSFIMLIVTPVSAQHGAPNGDWPYWGGDAGSTRYSALDQINKIEDYQKENEIRHKELITTLKKERRGTRILIFISLIVFLSLFLSWTIN